MPEEDAKENEFSVENGSRILSVYELKDGTKIWVLKEADVRHVTLQRIALKTQR